MSKYSKTSGKPVRKLQLQLLLLRQVLCTILPFAGSHLSACLWQSVCAVHLLSDAINSAIRCRHGASDWPCGATNPARPTDAINLLRRSTYVRGKLHLTQCHQIELYIERILAHSINLLLRGDSPVSGLYIAYSNLSAWSPPWSLEKSHYQRVGKHVLGYRGLKPKRRRIRQTFHRSRSQRDVMGPKFAKLPINSARNCSISIKLLQTMIKRMCGRSGVI